jgi:transposase
MTTGAFFLRASIRRYRVHIDRKTVRRAIARGLEPPVYGPRKPRPRLIDPFVPYLRERVTAYPGLTGRRLWRELHERGYAGGYTAVTDVLRELRPTPLPAFEVRFETPPGDQAQVDFAHFQVVFTDDPSVTRIVWLFSFVLGYSRLIWARYVLHQDMQTVLRCQMAAFEAIGGIPKEILYDRMKTAVIGQAGGSIVYNRALIDFARHYGFQPKACRPYRAKTKGKVERPYRYIREDFFLGGSFRNLDDLNAQLREWLDTIANPRVHATTQRVVNEAFAEEKPYLGALPLASFRSVLKLERRVSHEGMVSVGGNLYSVPDATRKRIVEVHTLANEVQIFEDGILIATHPVGNGGSRLAIARCRASSIAAVTSRSRSCAPVTQSQPGPSTSTKPSANAWRVRESDHELPGSCPLGPRPHSQYPGRSEDAEGAGSTRSGSTPARAWRS